MHISTLTLTGPSSAKTRKWDKAYAGVRHGVVYPREQLAGTARVLAQRLRAPGRVKDKAHDNTKTVHAKAEQAKQQLRQGGQAVQHKASQATLKANKLAGQGRSKLPMPTVGRFRGRLRPRPVFAIAVVLSVGLTLRWLLNNNR